MSPRKTSTSARLATAFLAALLVFVVAVPTVGACCVTKPGIKMAAMHASMPCCAERCVLTTSKAASNHDVTAISAPAPETAVVVVVTLANASATADASAGHAAIEPSSLAFSLPPPFLLHSQFRI